jgi:hypothetical protein
VCFLLIGVSYFVCWRVHSDKTKPVLKINSARNMVRRCELAEDISHRNEVWLLDVMVVKSAHPAFCEAMVSLTV